MTSGGSERQTANAEPWRSDGLTPLSALQRLVAAGLLYATPERGPCNTMAAAADAGIGHLWLVHWAMMGQVTGHEWHCCPVCAQIQLMPIGKRSCHLTPGCGGLMVRLAKRPRLTKRLRAVLASEGIT
jgi:hypothetical protein